MKVYVYACARASLIKTAVNSIVYLDAFQIEKMIEKNRIESNQNAGTKY